MTSTPLIGIVMMLAAQIIMPVNDSLAKYLVAILPAEQIAWARFFFNTLLLLPFILVRHKGAVLRVENIPLQIIRGLTIVAANILFVVGVRYVPLADALTLVFIAPLVVAALSAAFLREYVSRGQWLAILVGFAGALIIIRPGRLDLEPMELLPLIAGTLFAIYLVITRRLAGTAPAVVTQFISALVGAVLLTAWMPFVWEKPSPEAFAMLVGIGALSLAGHLLITMAHVHAKASTLAPLTYLAIVTATILGYFMFDDIPTLTTWLGAAIVIGSGLYVWRTQS